MSLIKRLFGGAKSGRESQDIDFLLARGVEVLRAKTAAHGAWGFGREESWNVDQDTGDIIFELADGIVAQAPVQIIGSVNTLDGTWLWSWANPSIDPALTRDALAMREYGATNGVAFLTERKYEASEERAWQLTALSVYLNNAQGAYRGPAGTVLLFMTFGEVQLTKS